MLFTLSNPPPLSQFNFNGKQTGETETGRLGLGVNFSKHGGGRRDKIRGVGCGKGVWANADGGKVRGGVSLRGGHE